MKKLTIKDLYLNKENYKDKEISISAWVRTVRDSKSFGFIELNDGTYFKNLQIVFNDTLENFEDIKKLTISSTITVTLSGIFLVTVAFAPTLTLSPQFGS